MVVQSALTQKEGLSREEKAEVRTYTAGLYEEFKRQHAGGSSDSGGRSDRGADDMIRAYDEGQGKAGGKKSRRLSVNMNMFRSKAS
jgi:hypothetical protein